MDDLKPVIYIIFLLIYLASRFFRKAKKQPQEQGMPQQEAHPVDQKPESLFDTIREEIKRQQELAKEKERQEQSKKQPQPAFQKPAAKTAVKKVVQKTKRYESLSALDTVGQEGVSAFSEASERAMYKNESETSSAFEFDPRHAFMMKTLLERHPAV